MLRALWGGNSKGNAGMGGKKHGAKDTVAGEAGSRWKEGSGIRVHASHYQLHCLPSTASIPLAPLLPPPPPTLPLLPLPVLSPLQQLGGERGGEVEFDNR